MKKHMFPIFLALLAGFATVGGAIWQALEKKKASEKAEANQKTAEENQRKAEENQKKADLYFEKLLAANEEIKKLNLEVNSKASSIIESNSKLIEAQGETIKKVMGSGHARIKIGGVNESELKCYVESTSNYPMYEVEITICNYNKIIKCSTSITNGKIVIGNKCFLENSMIFGNTFTLNSDKTRPLGYTLSKDERHYLFIKIVSKHNTTFQYSIIEGNKTSKSLLHAYRIFESLNDGSMKLIEDESKNIPEDVWVKNFHYKKDIYINSYD